MGSAELIVARAEGALDCQAVPLGAVGGDGVCARTSSARMAYPSAWRVDGGGLKSRSALRPIRIAESCQRGLGCAEGLWV